ncbi:MAG: YebC/PmpR family DNA-binding transcriptional regulator [Candidatus Pacebacteria bacterium]|nr:YebC/PmpR family DNA-binding transcriptional regulator [Candidatus Paceibacterota bacterium]
MGSSHKKQGKIADNNAKKSKIFSKLVRLIQVEAKLCGGDVNSAGLKTAIEKARKASVPKDTIDRAIKKANEVGDTTAVMYEAYGPAGTGMIITGLTNNNNRTSQEIKAALSKNGGSLGSQGSVAWNFTQDTERNWIPNSTMEISETDKEQLDIIIEALEENDDVQDIYINVK